MNYTPKPSSRITPSIGENRMKIRSVDFEISAFRQTDRRGGETLLYIYKMLPLKYEIRYFIEYLVIP